MLVPPALLKQAPLPSPHPQGISTTTSLAV